MADLTVNVVPKTLSFLAAITFVPALYYIVDKLFVNRTIKRFYASQPWAGRKSGQWFSGLRASFNSFLNNADQIKEAYTKYAKNNIPFLVPNFRKGAFYVIPPEMLKTVLGSPETKLEARVPMAETVASKYTIGDADIQPIELNNRLLRKDITKRIGLLAEGLSEEVSFAFDEVWGTSQEWKTVVIWSSLEEIIARAINRVVFPGLLSRNDDCMKPLLKYTTAVLWEGLVIDMFPELLQRIFGPLISWRSKRHCQACIRFLIPHVEERLKLFKMYKEGVNDGWEPPKDILQWQIEQSSSTGKPEQMEPGLIAHRLIIFHFSNIDPTSIALTQILHDLYSSPPSKGFVDIIRDECETVLKETPEGHWTKEALSRLVLLDSTLRESMRHSGFGWTALLRRVVSPAGLPISPSITIPHGVTVGVPMHSIHMDPDYHPNPTEFSPFRFAPPSHPSSPAPTLNLNSEYSKSLVTLDATFLGFGYRQFACPGRHIAAHVMKVIVATMLLKYEVGPLKERPSQINLMELRIPRMGTTLKVRRRKDSDDTLTSCKG
ncbi:MAG: hypothetical protein Q9160_005542 [Pyrenula sp. 1 TL-2023]